MLDGAEATGELVADAVRWAVWRIQLRMLLLQPGQLGELFVVLLVRKKWLVLDVVRPVRPVQRLSQRLDVLQDGL